MRRLLKVLGLLLMLILLIAAGLGAWFYYSVTQSLPILEDTVQMKGLDAPVTVERDELGVPTIRAENRDDVARALGFLHAQERFFQMDLLRRQAAGELAELVGEAATRMDRAARLHRLRPHARRVVEATSPKDRALLQAYVDGVNAGLDALGKKPFEYLVLGVNPVPWREEDSVLTVLAMYFVLNDERGGGESARGLLRDALPLELAKFLSPAGTEWDAPVQGSVYGTGPIPGPEVLDLRQQTTEKAAASREREGLPELISPGSNNWAVSGSRTAHGEPILANDMHLEISVPNTWYRAQFEWPAEDGSFHRVTGVTLPGLPAMVVGSNGHVAWGFTNTGGDWSDLIIVEVHPDDPEQYLTPDGYRRFERHTETIAVRDGESQTLEVVSTIWGPLVDRDHHGRPRAIRWIAHEVEGVNMRLYALEDVGTVTEAQAAANRSGIPPQNFVCVDRSGNIGWTVAGMIPRRIGFDGSVPTSWAYGLRYWDGWLEPEEYPRIVNPDVRAIWTANHRVVDGEMAAKIGHGSYDIGARAGQIRDALLKLEGADEEDMLGIQLDDRALFLERWRDFLLELLDSDAVDGRPARARFRNLLDTTWTGRASIDSVAYRLTRAFRFAAFERVYGWLTAPCREADDTFRLFALGQWEGPLWKLITEQPLHLLDPQYESWNEALLSVVDEVIEELDRDDETDLEDRTWGEYNTTRIQHPLSRALPVLSDWLDMPRQPLPGDSNMPRVQHPSSGASERLAVSPGREEEAYFHMPCGQSGHPLSPYYRAGHDAWAEGRPTPFLPGPTKWKLTLVPVS
jgi:penicillin amidase